MQFDAMDGLLLVGRFSIDVESEPLVQSCTVHQPACRDFPFTMFARASAVMSSLRGISLEARQGDVVSLLGGYSSGKSTLLRPPHVHFSKMQPKLSEPNKALARIFSLTEPRRERCE
jgi:ABC-type transport system involved in cytochrome bd biosynthesis fused ATPase/permease subunit